MRTGIGISKKMFCPFCNKETKVCSKFVYNEINCNKLEPWCVECKNKLTIFENEFYDNFNNFLQQARGFKYYAVRFIISHKYKNFAFEAGKPIYNYENNNGWLFGISIAIFWFILVIICFLSESSLDAFFLMIMPIPSYIILISNLVVEFKIKRVIDMFSYIVNNGKCYKGIVKNVLEFQSDNGIDKHYFLEVEYFDDINKEKKTVITPEIVKLPNKSDIECDVYVVEELPEKYKNFKDRRNTAIINFR